ncbi:hypothetical protein Tco_0527586 [Tanacetum coccineum]
MLVKQSEKIDTISYHRLFDILKQFQKDVNDIRAERIAKSANPLALLAAAQPYSDTYYQAPKPQRSNATSSSTRQSASTRHKGKEVAKPITPQSESVSEEDSDPEQAKRDKYNTLCFKGEAISLSDSCLIALPEHNRMRFEKYKAFNDRKSPIDYDDSSNKVKDTLRTICFKRH